MAFKKDTLKYFWDRLNNLKANREELITVDFENGDEGVSSKNIFNLIYPIGSYYWSKNSTSPNELFGGVWEQVKDTFILAAGDNYEVNTTGGETEVTITAEQMANHYHDLGFPINNVDVRPIGVTTQYGDYTSLETTTSGGTKYLSTALGYSSASSSAPVYPIHTSYTGSGEAHNNMPPYRVAYCWCRIG